MSARHIKNALALSRKLKCPISSVLDYAKGLGMSAYLDGDKPMVSFKLGVVLLQTHGYNRKWETLRRWYKTGLFGDASHARPIGGIVYVDAATLLRVARERDAPRGKPMPATLPPGRLTTHAVAVRLGMTDADVIGEAKARGGEWYHNRWYFSEEVVGKWEAARALR